MSMQYLPKDFQPKKLGPGQSCANLESGLAITEIEDRESVSILEKIDLPLPPESERPTGACRE